MLLWSKGLKLGSLTYIFRGDIPGNIRTSMLFVLQGDVVIISGMEHDFEVVDGHVVAPFVHSKVPGQGFRVGVHLLYSRDHRAHSGDILDQGDRTVEVSLGE